jgi:1-acyl-sn-glycerol-3-phosphate acyltransferase
MLTWVLRRFVAFIGKESLAKVPLFGYYFRELHVPVNRRNAGSRHAAQERAMDLVAQDRSVVFFPEGAINQDIQPGMMGFKDGAFRVAIENQIPIVPITICYNWLILPADFKGARFHKAEIVMHDPIDTKGMTLADVEELKQRCWTLINDTLVAKNATFLKN